MALDDIVTSVGDAQNFIEELPASAGGTPADIVSSAPLVEETYLAREQVWTWLS